MPRPSRRSTRLLDEPEFDEGHVFMLHRALLPERLADIDHPAGAWKREPNYGTYIGPDGRQAWREFPGSGVVPLLMQQWLSRLNESPEDMPAPDAARADAERQLEFVTIHPFVDGNGRLARLLANIPVLRSGHPPIVIPAAAKREYIRCLSEYQETVTDLPGLRDLGRLPANAEREVFVAFCAAQWEETLSLVREARAMQTRR